MGYYASEVIKLAKEELGYLEKETNAHLDEKTMNAGDKNWTKYARDLYNAGYYNGNKNGFSWCDIFIDWLFFKAFGKEKGQEIECQTGLYGAGCEYSAKYYKDQNRFDKKPRVGDQIFFLNNSGVVGHTGLVVEIQNGIIYTIEGNTSPSSGVVANGGCVASKSYSSNYSRIYGYGHPKYSDSSDTAPITLNKGSVCEVILNVLKKGDSGASVKALQILLIGNGYSCGSCGPDSSFGPDTDTAVRKYQKDKGLSIDGFVGPATWAKLLK